MYADQRIQNLVDAIALLDGIRPDVAGIDFAWRAVHHAGLARRTKAYPLSRPANRRPSVTMKTQIINFCQLTPSGRLAASGTGSETCSATGTALAWFIVISMFQFSLPDKQQPVKKQPHARDEVPVGRGEGKWDRHGLRRARTPLAPEHVENRRQPSEDVPCVNPGEHEEEGAVRTRWKKDSSSAQLLPREDLSSDKCYAQGRARQQPPA